MTLTAAMDPGLMRAQARVGLTLREKWRLDRLLGVGGMAAVYAGTHRNGSRGAIKMLHLDLSLDPDVKRRFLREGYLANAVDHPSVVRVIDDDVADDGSVFIVMELLAGETLDARWERSNKYLDAAEVLSAVDPILSVLIAAHEKGIVHRDIKPENIFVCEDGSLKLLDFGIARLRESSATATMTGLAMGTPAFMPPEQALGKSDQVGPQSDLWAVGATMFTLLTGRFVHEGQTTNEQLVRAATQQAPRVSDLSPALHPAVAQVVDVALAFDPADRWPDAATMQQAARDAYHAMAGSPVQTAPKLVVPQRGASVDEEPTQYRPLVETTGSAAVGHKTIAPTRSVQPPITKIALGVAAVAVAVAAVSVTVMLTRAPSSTSASATAAPAQSADPATAPEPASAPSATGSVAQPPPPTVAPVDPAPAVSDTAKVTVRMSGPTPCTVVVAKANHGSTPVELELPAGKHRITCTLANGTVLFKNITVAAGKSDTVTFASAKAAPVDPLNRRRTR